MKLEHGQFSVEIIDNIIYTRLEGEFNEHGVIASAVAAGDVPAAEKAMRAHLGRAEALLSQTINDFPDYFE